MLDADTGALLKTMNTDRGVLGDVTVVPHSTGRAIYAYAADLGGNVYRVNIGSNAPADWTITKIASLGCDTVQSCSANRKFMFAPDVVEENGICVLLIGSGDREKPLTNYTSAYGEANHFFMLKDKPTDSMWLSLEANNCSGAELICKDSLVPITSDANPTQASWMQRKAGTWALPAMNRW